MPQDTLLTDADFAAAALTLGCEVAAFRAVAEVESAYSGLLPDGRPTILFEAHVFDKLTNQQFRNMRDRHGVPLASLVWDQELYGPTNAPLAHQYDRLEDAADLAWGAAHQACRWGRFQTLGRDYRGLGFTTVKDFVWMMQTERGQLDVFARFILLDKLDVALCDRDWHTFARRYNGPTYEANRYHTKMAEAYERLK